MSPHSAQKATSNEPKDILERSLQMLERSQAILERSLAMESTLSRLVEGQEELRRMMMDFIHGTDIPVATPTRSNRIDLLEREPAHPVKEEEEEDEIEGTDLPPMTSDCPVERYEEEDISSLSFVSYEEDIYQDDEEAIEEDTTSKESTSAHGLGGEVVIQENEMAEDDEGCSTSSGGPGSSYQIEKKIDSKTKTKTSVNPSCKKCGKTYVELLSMRDHVGAHLNMKMHCPFLGCEYSGNMGSVKHHLSSIHETTLSKLTNQERDRFEEIRRKFNEDVDAVIGDYFHEQTKERSPICKKCGKDVPKPNKRRDHVAVHLKAKFPCPFHDCRYSGHVGAMLIHLHNKHGKNLQKLTKEQRGRFEESRSQFHEKVDAVMEEYFPCTC